jgi:hypothetical protein
MPAITETLRDAQNLAVFSNLEPDGVEYFRHNYPDFVPQEWWSYQSGRTSKPQWQFNQNYLREIWRGRFADNLFHRMLLVLSVFDPNDMSWMWPFRDPDAVKPAFISLDEMNAQHTYPYHKAAMFLFAQPWRARFCAECNKRFVAATSQNLYCSSECFQVARNRQRLKWWNKKGKKQRKKRYRPRLPKGPVRQIRP